MCTSPSDCPATGTPCIVAQCAAGVCATQASEEGTACSTDGGGKVCADGACVDCNTTGDCGAGDVCTATHLCISECVDGTRDGAETDVDCGGGTCPPCATGQGCQLASDCVAPDPCDDGVCTACASGLGQPCGSCGGKIACDGSCTVATPPSYGTSCGSCGGTVECDETCSVPTPPNVGATCDTGIACKCGYTLQGTITCAGTCVADDVCSCCGSEPC